MQLPQASSIRWLCSITQIQSTLPLALAYANASTGVAPACGPDFEPVQLALAMPPSE